METTSVVNVPNENVLDDAVLNPVQPETEPVSDIAEVTQESAPAKEPGWIRSRIDKAVAKAIRETEERMSQQFEQTLAPIRESMMERQAQDLVSSGEFKSKEVALEYVRLKGGNVSVAAPTDESARTQRDQQGRFVSQQQQPEEDPVARAQASFLAKQAEKIRNTRGIDVMQIFNADPDVQQRVLSGEWDFYDVAEQAGARGSIPRPIRSSNGATMTPTTIANMTDAQFQKLQENLAAGKVYNAG